MNIQETLQRASSLDFQRIAERRSLQERLKASLAEGQDVAEKLAGFPTVPGWDQEALALYQSHSLLKLNLGTITQQLASSKEVFTQLLKTQELAKTKEMFYSQLLENVTQLYVSKLDDILNEVYLYVYQDPTKRIKIALEERYNKKVLQLKIFTKVGDDEYEESVDDEGHSVAVVLGTIFLIYFIQFQNLPRVVIFDETFSGLSQETIDRFFPFLKLFAEKQGFEFLVISHDGLRLNNFIDRVYQVTNGVYTLQGDKKAEVTGA